MSPDSFCIDSSGNVESEKLRNFVYTTKQMKTNNLFRFEAKSKDVCEGND